MWTNGIYLAIDVNYLGITESTIFEMHLGFLIKQGLFDKFVETWEEKKRMINLSLKDRVGVSPRMRNHFDTERFSNVDDFEKRGWSIPLEGWGWCIPVDDMI